MPVGYYKKTFNITTDETGAWQAQYSVRGQLLAVFVELGDGGTALSTPDIAITDEPSGDNLLTVAGVASDGKYYPQVITNDPADGTAGDDYTSPGIFGKVQVAVAGGGDTKSGKVHLLIAR